MIHAGTATAVHDVSDGGLLIALAEMAIAGGIGARLDEAPEAMVPHAWWFGEDQGRYIVTVNEKDLLSVFTKLKAVEVPCVQIGLTGGHELAVAGEGAVHVERLKHAFENWLPAYMNGKAS
jgi:phosphoribosylformylglycinamidine synthase